MWHYILITFGLCFCLVIITSNKKTNQITSTSIEVNFIDTKQFTTQINTSNGVPSEQKNGSSAKSKKKIHIPKFMFDLYEERKRDDYGLNRAQPDIVRSVIPKNAGTFSDKNILKTFEENHILEFDIPISNQEETFFNAELRILTLINPNKTTSGVERFIRVSAYDESTNTLILLHERHVYHTDNTWITFNLTKLVDELFKKYLKLVISVKAFCPFLKYTTNHFKLSLLPLIEDIQHDYPILLLSYLSRWDEKGRKKRNVEEDYEEESNRIWDNEQQNKAQSKKTRRLRNTCKRKQLYIDFAEIHYDSWIVQPSGYEAYQCTGRCFYPVAEHLSPTKHAIVQALMHSVAPSRAARSCCVPSKLDSISLLYVDERGIPTYRYGYNDMVVVECGCR